MTNKNTISLKPRFNAAMLALEAASRGLSTRERLLVQIHASELNGCTFCQRMHNSDLSFTTDHEF